MNPMSELKQALRNDLTAALKAGDTQSVATIRMALASVSKAEVAGKVARELSDDEVVGVLTGEVKRRREAAVAYEAADRPELAAQELAEAAVLGRYLPDPLTAAQVAELVAEAVTKAEAQGLAGGRALGVVMKQLKPATSGRYDGTELAALAKSALGM
jgi:uncharacterized protein YqeY